MSAPIPSFEEQVPMPEVLYPDLPDVDFDYSEDATPRESVPIPFADFIDLYSSQFFCRHYHYHSLYRASLFIDFCDDCSGRVRWS